MERNRYWNASLESKDGRATKVSLEYGPQKVAVAISTGNDSEKVRFRYTMLKRLTLCGNACAGIVSPLAVPHALEELGKLIQVVRKAASRADAEWDHEAAIQYREYAEQAHTALERVGGMREVGTEDPRIAELEEYCESLIKRIGQLEESSEKCF